MEKKDILYLIGAVVIVAVLAMVIKPALTQGSLPFSYGSPLSTDAEGETTRAPSPEVTSLPTVTPLGGAWDGEVVVLHFLDEVSANEMNETLMTRAIPVPTPRIFVGNSTVTAANPVIPTYKPSIPEGATHKPSMEYRGLLNTSTIYEQTFELRYNSVGFLVDVVKPPFALAYSTVPTTSDPYYLNNPYYCFMTITVRDPKTMAVITEEGYGRVYSTDAEKIIILYRSGTYHVTLYGNMVKVTVMVEAGI
ncbi:MAG: hypothetical protein LUO93_07860 [Methanomicrobiales archaeon]|nr:hypothetical protein [Methanomicrobiales archaeon]